MQAIVEEHVAAIRAAIINAENAAEALEDEAVKAAAKDALADLHEAANKALTHFRSLVDDGLSAVALRGGGGKEDPPALAE